MEPNDDHKLKSIQSPEKATPERYNRVLDRLKLTLENAELNSWDYLQEKIEEAVEIELTAEEMTRDEIDLMSAYLKRDLKQLGFYAHETGEGIAAWLNFDLNILEQKLAQSLVALADQTRVDQERLREQLANGEDEYIAGEVATAGTFECLECDSVYQQGETHFVRECKACGCALFKRKSNPWPSE